MVHLLGRTSSQSGNSAASSRQKPSLIEAREKVQQTFSVRLCRWQYEVPNTIWDDKNVILDVSTGQGKTITFFLGSLLASEGVHVIITPLNVLGDQNVDQLVAAGIPAIAINARTATRQNFEVLPHLLNILEAALTHVNLSKDIKSGKYRLVITSPEQFMKIGGGFDELLRMPEFVERLGSIVFDEAHCIIQWGTFRPEYTTLSRLRYQLPNTPFIFASATFSSLVLDDIKSAFGLTGENTNHIRRSNDRPNVHIGVRKIEHSMSSFRDLGFLVPDGWKEGDSSPDKFLIFFDSIAEAVGAALFLRHRLPCHLRDKIIWFHSDMSENLKAEAVEKLKRGEIWGICATDAFGMVRPLVSNVTAD